MKNIWLSAKIGAAIRKSINFLLLVEFYRMVKAFPLFHPFAFSSRGYSIERSPLTGKYKKKKGCCAANHALMWFLSRRNEMGKVFLLVAIHTNRLIRSSMFNPRCSFCFSFPPREIMTGTYRRSVSTHSTSDPFHTLHALVVVYRASLQRSIYVSRYTVPKAEKVNWIISWSNTINSIWK